jgi:cobyrinic acid a,c-diamide synthase
MPAFVVAGTHSGVGKTSISVGLMAALRRRGLVVQPFKVGPDFIDPAHHEVASGRLARNLDGWMLNRDANLAVVAGASDGADACVVEGMMGLFDGIDGASEDGSTAQIAKWLGLPVVLVVDAYALSRSAAAIVKGYAELDPALDVAGVIFNRVGSATHLNWLTDATRSVSKVAVLGGIPHDSDVAFPERHLGLVMPDEHRAHAWIQAMADLVERHVDIDQLLNSSWTAPTATRLSAPVDVAPARARIAIARDEAFCFYYQDNLDLLRQFGAELIEFSPLRDRLPPDLDGLYLGGGYPELLAADLARNGETMDEVRTFAAAGRAIYAECGGLMYLSRGIEDVAGTRHEMCGVLPFWTQLTSTPTLGYVEVTASRETWFPTGDLARGQTFHYSRIHPDDATSSLPAAYQASVNGSAAGEGFVQHNVVASYLHLHWRSNPAFAKAFVDACIAQPSPDRAGQP